MAYYDIFSNINKGFDKVTNFFTNLSRKEAIKFYFLLVIIILSFASLIPAMTMKPPCKDGNYYQNKQNCTLLGSTDDSTMLEWIQEKYLGFYIMNILSSCVCIIFAFVLMFYVLDTN